MWPIVLVSITLNVVAPASRDATVALNTKAIHAMVNQARVAHGLTPFNAAAALAGAARRHSGEMARAGKIFHSQNLHSKARGWPALGENVGLASNAADVVSYFLQSPSHRSLIMDRTFSHQGVGVVFEHGSLWVTIFFGGPAG